MKNVRIALSALAVGTAFAGTYAAANDAAFAGFYVKVTSSPSGNVYSCESVSYPQTCTVATTSGVRCTIAITIGGITTHEDLWKLAGGSGTTPCTVPLYKP